MTAAELPSEPPTAQATEWTDADLCHPTNAAMTRARMRRAYELRRRGWAYARIADRLGYADHSSVRNAVAAVAQQIPQEIETTRRALIEERLDNAIEKILDGFADADPDKALARIDRLIKLTQEQIKLYGLDRTPDDDNSIHVGTIIIHGADYVPRLREVIEASGREVPANIEASLANVAAEIGMEP